MSEDKILTAQGSTVYETVSGILGRHVASFSYPEDAAAYVDWMNNRDTRHRETMAGIAEIKEKAELAAAQIATLTAENAELQARLADAKEKLERSWSGREIARLKGELEIAWKQVKAGDRVRTKLEVDIQNARLLSDEMNGRLGDLLEAYEEVVAGNQALSQRAEKAEAEREKLKETASAWTIAALRHYPQGWAFDATNPEGMIANIVRGVENARDGALEFAKRETAKATAAQAKERELRGVLEKALPIVASASLYVDHREVSLADEISAALAPGGGTGGEE